jgi:hypothetical protein
MCPHCRPVLCCLEHDDDSADVDASSWIARRWFVRQSEGGLGGPWCRTLLLSVASNGCTWPQTGCTTYIPEPEPEPLEVPLTVILGRPKPSVRLLSPKCECWQNATLQSEPAATAYWCGPLGPVHSSDPGTAFVASDPARTANDPAKFWGWGAGQRCHGKGPGSPRHGLTQQPILTVTN